jgi:hypothetical protein
MSRVPIAEEFQKEVRVPVSAEAITARPWGVGIPWSGPDPKDRFAPLRAEHVCFDRAGRWRSRHEFDGDGACFWCWVRE